MRKILGFALALALAVPALGADFATGVWYGTDTRTTKLQFTVTVPATSTTPYTIEITDGVAALLLKRVIVSAVACVNCDVAIVDATGTTGDNIVFSEDVLVAATPVPGGTAYTQYTNQVPDTTGSPAVPAIEVNERRLTVYLTNADGAGRVVTVSLWMEEL